MCVARAIPKAADMRMLNDTPVRSVRPLRVSGLVSRSTL